MAYVRLFFVLCFWGVTTWLHASSQDDFIQRATIHTKTLKGNAFKMIPITQAHESDLKLLLKNQQVMTYYEGGQVKTDECIHMRAELWAKRWTKETEGNYKDNLSWWMLYADQTGDEQSSFIGAVGMYFHKLPGMMFDASSLFQHYIELSYLIHPDHQRKGYASSALHAAMTFVENENLSCRGFYVMTQEENTASRKLIESLGFKLTEKDKNRLNYIKTL